MKRWFMMVLMCCALTAQAQFGSFYADQPFLAKDTTASFTPLSVPGLTYWFVSEDLTLNAAVTSWTDRISSKVFQNTGSVCPSNTSSGLFFARNLSQCLTNLDQIAFSTNANTTFVILKFGWIATFSEVLGYRETGDLNIMGDTATTGTPNLEWFGGSVRSSGPVLTNVYMDFILSASLPLNKAWWYTNGIFAVTNASAFSKYSYGRVGGQAGQFFHGYIYEIAVWSNYCVTATEAAQLHTYATNKYGFSP